MAHTETQRRTVVKESVQFRRWPSSSKGVYIPRGRCDAPSAQCGFCFFLRMTPEGKGRGNQKTIVEL
jgi:hypothetical protein